MFIFIKSLNFVEQVKDVMFLFKLLTTVKCTYLRELFVEQTMTQEWKLCFEASFLKLCDSEKVSIHCKLLINDIKTKVQLS